MSDQIRLSISLPTDERGFIGRQCPNPKCHSYFKIKPGTGIIGKEIPVHCPYCGHIGDSSDFVTPDQLEYAKSIAVREFQKSLGNMVSNWGRDLERSTRGGFIQFKVEYKENPQPIQYYREKKLETLTTCSSCTLEYSVFGLFSFCPDCGIHNSIQIFNQNLELAKKMVSLAKELVDADLSIRLIEESLQSVISALDGFGRVICNAAKNKAKLPEKIEGISFQNIQKAKTEIITQFGFDISSSINDEEWKFVNTCFQKRHLLAHSFGIVDQKFVDKTNDTSIKIGKRIFVSEEEVINLITFVKLIGAGMSERIR
ncbi:MAG: hypothetical protein CVU43_01690 [Chloroflexi bacterium HGW-Chloroflexi-5]|jgi:hypothetical protein|nr:MAG: hypothetical protein CVU43_01690 [Chloroflexi bacterium HGW-Chloroflexi-5]